MHGYGLLERLGGLTTRPVAHADIHAKWVDMFELQPEMVKAMQEIIFQYKIDPDKIKNIHDAIVGNAGRVVNDNMICAGDPNPPPGAEFTRDTCQGDSGGPLVAKAGGKPIQVGIVSWGHGCGLPKVYGVYTRLGNFIDWIRSVTK